MTSAEKRYFSQQSAFGSGTGPKDYLRLFEFIQSMDAYDEEIISRHFAGHTFVKFLPQAKKFLYDRLTDSLHRFHSSYSVSEEIKKALHVSKILINKKLDKQALILLDRTSKKIKVHELYEHFPEYYEVRRMLPNQVFKKLDKDALNREAQEYDEHVKMLEQRNRTWLSKSCMTFLHSKKIKVQDREEQLFLNDVFERSKEQSTQPGQDFLSRIYHHNLQATYSFMNNDIQSAYTSNKEILGLFHQNPEFLKIYPGNYVSALNNFLIDNMVMGKFDIVERELETFIELREVKPFNRWPGLSSRILELGSTLKLNLFVSQNAFKGAGDYADELWPGIQKHRNTLSTAYLINTMYILSYIKFANGCFDEALRFQNGLRNEYLHQMPLELQQSLHILFVLTHFELGNFDVIESLVIAAKRFNTRKRKLYKTEHVVFKFIRSSAEMESPGRRFDWVKLKQALANCAASDARLYNYFDFDLWLEGKLKGVSMGEAAV